MTDPWWHWPSIPNPSQSSWSSCSLVICLPQPLPAVCEWFSAQTVWDVGWGSGKTSPILDMPTRVHEEEPWVVSVLYPDQEALAHLPPEPWLCVFLPGLVSFSVLVTVKQALWACTLLLKHQWLNSSFHLLWITMLLTTKHPWLLGLAHRPAQVPFSCAPLW